MPDFAFFFAAGTRHSGHNRVYVKSSWGHDWELVEGLHCEDCVFATAPGISTATFYWRFGRGVMNPATSGYSRIEAKELNRKYVKVEWYTSWTPAELAAFGDLVAYTWYGVFEVDERIHFGVLAHNDAAGFATTTVSGEQGLFAFGMEILLEQYIIDHSIFWDGERKRVDRGIEFNDRGRPNKSVGDVGGGFAVFSQAEQPAEHWSSQDIAFYLVDTHKLRNGADVARIPITMPLAEGIQIANWDTPRLPQHGRRLWSLLNQVIARERMLGFYVDVDPLANALQVRPFTFTDVALPLRLVARPDRVGIDVHEPVTIPANPDAVIIQQDGDESADLSVKHSTLDTYDAVHVRGARIRVCGTFSFEDANMTVSWAAADATQYNSGASGWTDFAALGLSKKRQLHDEARAVAELEAVYARFEILAPWDGLLGKGLDGTPGDLAPAMPLEVEFESYPLYQRDLAILESLPLIAGVDYSGSRIGDDVAAIHVDEADHVALGERPPLVMWTIPATFIPATENPRRMDVTKIGSAGLKPAHRDQNFKWACDVIVEPGENGIWLRVTGQPREVIAEGDFVATAEDRFLGKNNFRKACFTLAVHGDKYCEGIARAPGFAAAGLDAVRRLILYAGEDYRKDYVAACTVIGADEDGELLRSDGGWLHDDEHILQGVAEAALQWYGTARAVLRFRTNQIKDRFHRGQIVTRVDRSSGVVLESIGTPITSIRLTYQHSADGAPAPPATMEITTDQGEYDPLTR